MLTEICAYLKNYFIRDENDIHSDHYKIVNGQLTNAPFLLDGQYYRVVGSILNDGVHKKGDRADILNDEEFDGAVWSMSVPLDIVALAADIVNWQATNNDVLTSPYQSESFGGYNYSKKTSANSSGGSYSWRDQFASRLNPYRRLFLP